MGFPGGAVVKNPPVSAGDTRGARSIPGSGRPPGRGNGNPFQYSCLKNPTDRGAWQATVHGVAKSQTRLKRVQCTVSDSDVSTRHWKSSSCHIIALLPASKEYGGNWVEPQCRAQDGPPIWHCSSRLCVTNGHSNGPQGTMPCSIEPSCLS